MAEVVENFWQSSPELQALFEDFRAISGLELNVKKTIMIPLWRFSNIHHVKTLIKETCAKWANIHVNDKGKYLGFWIGPGAVQDCWSKALEKFERQVTLRAGMKMGMAMNSVAFNVYIVTLLEFVAQVCVPDRRVEAIAEWALRTGSPSATWRI